MAGSIGSKKEMSMETKKARSMTCKVQEAIKGRVQGEALE